MILIIIGTVIGTWILAGTIPTLIYYGLDILSPNIFLPASFVLSAIISVLIGSSFGTIATIGIVLLGIGEGLGVPVAMTVGSLVSGSMFGDKISPLSDSTNLTAAITGTPLFSHVKSMLYISGPAVILSLVLYFFTYDSSQGSTDLTLVNEISTVLSEQFNLGLLTLIPVVAVAVLLMFRIPAIPTLALSFLVSALTAILVQGAGFTEVIDVAANGYVANTGFELVDSLLTQGGITAMMGTVAIIILATAMGGILEETKILQTILDSFADKITKPRDLILATLAGGYLILIATGEMFVSVIIPGKIFQPVYDKIGVNRNVLSRSLETSATLGCSILPWGIVATYTRDVLGVGFEYIPYSYFPIIAPIIAIVFAVIGYATFKKEPKQNVEMT